MGLSCFSLWSWGVVKKGYGINWETLIQQVNIWAKNLSVEVAEPDLWAELSHMRSGFSFDAGGIDSNEPVTAREAREIKLKLGDLQQKITQEYASSEEVSDIINEKFIYLTDCIERQGKKDWVHTLIGVLASLAIAIGVSAANSDSYWKLIKDTLGTPIKLLLGN